MQAAAHQQRGQQHQGDKTADAVPAIAVPEYAAESPRPIQLLATEWAAKKPAEKSSIPVKISPSDEKSCDSLNEEEIKWMLHVLWYTGMRIGEVVQLHPEDYSTGMKNNSAGEKINQTFKAIELKHTAHC